MTFGIWKEYLSFIGFRTKKPGTKRIAVAWANCDAMKVMINH